MKQTGFQKAVGMIAATQSTLVTLLLFFYRNEVELYFHPSIAFT